MRTTSAINFYCRPSKETKKGVAPIEVSIIINSKRCFINLPRKENPTVFEKEIKKKHSELNAYLEGIRTVLNEAQNDLTNKGLTITANNLRTYLKTGGKKAFTISDMFDEYITILEKRVGVDLTDRTFDKYITVRKEFETYFGTEREVNTITSSDIQTYYVDLNRKFNTNTTAGKMRKLKSIFRFAFENGKIPTFPFNNIKVVKEKPVIEFLTDEELEKIRDTPMPTERLQKTADLFIFEASTGLSYADMMSLEPSDIKNSDGVHYIHKNRVKTGVEYTSVILPDGMKILKKYNFKLPSLCNQNYNILLKLVAEICGIDKNIHSHLSRKTYATKLLNQGVPITSVSKALGHTQIKTTTRYYAKTFDSTVLTDIKKII